ncbi:hypothetical protein A5641_07290 [Mycobacterium sp. 1554424.7]|nr:hypothetical protein A5641_07290 [Mycobacterium sp. 1554424.7]
MTAPGWVEEPIKSYEITKNGRIQETTNQIKQFDYKSPTVDSQGQVRPTEPGRSQPKKLKKPIETYAPSAIILSTIEVLVLLQELAGLSLPFGASAWKGSSTYPYPGDCFQDASPHFTEAAALLHQACAPGWQGEAADSYRSATSTLITQAQTMADLHREMKNLVKHHAEVVSRTQFGIGIEQDALIAVLPVVIAKQSVLHTLPLAWQIAIAAATITLTAALSLLGWCLGTSIQTKQAVDGLAYDDVIAASQAVIDAYAPAAFPVPQSSQSAASDGEQVWGSVSESSGGSGTPSAASTPDTARGSGPTPLDAPSAEHQRLGRDSSPGVVTADQAELVTPSSPMPTLAQVSQPSGQAAHPSGNLTAPGSRHNPQDQQGAPEDAVRAGDSDDIAAGSATAGAERAPIDISAAGPQQAPASTSAPA